MVFEGHSTSFPVGPDLKGRITFMLQIMEVVFSFFGTNIYIYICGFNYLFEDVLKAWSSSRMIS